ncbi:hypothetical protein [Frondihabitans sp. VKM Ac-2883]|uniref:hypothetical protein n=1 Tax=Frondihabitans sp. VKM Ac-2883 TaxID=2783823 RepID=UPI00188C3AB5|nr:hypothetical protein [Frondihabitans sp. VKM Ac-2883]MBF4574715.1 hypothetical protein [Frondihabitans sp. VKM Ac-2883]
MTDTVAAAMTHSGADSESVARAADITLPELENRLAHREEFSISELLGLGGFFRIHPADLIAGRA